MLFSANAVTGKMKRAVELLLVTSGSQKTADGVAEGSQLIITHTNTCKQNSCSGYHGKSTDIQQTINIKV